MLTFALLALLASSTQGHPAHGTRGSTGHVLVVGAPRGFATIQAAVDQAEDGDSVLVKSGSYPGFAIGNKGISVVADTGATVVVDGGVSVAGVPAGLSALLAGLTIQASNGTIGLSAVDVAGGLRIEECSVIPFLPDRPAVLLDTDADVALVMCTLQGSMGGHSGRSGSPGWPAILSVSSSVAIQDCALLGGAGGDGYSDPPGAGGAGAPGISLDGGFVYVSGSDVRGGDGGKGGDNHQCTMGGDQGGRGGAGGAAVRVSSAPTSPAVILFGVVATPGAGGAGGIDYSDGYDGDPCWGNGADGAAGVPIDAPPGSADVLAGSSRRLIAPRVARENRAILAHAYGQPGDFFQVFASARPQFVYLPQFSGVQLVQLQPSMLLASGTVPAAGVLDLQLQMPNLPLESAPLFLQAYVRDTGEQRYAATEITLLELGSQF